MNEFALLDDAARGMAMQRTLLDLAARNVAAAQASTPGHPYARLIARSLDASPAETDDAFSDEAPSEMPRIVQVPGTGDPLTELIAALDAQRAYEADASLFDIGKRIAERTLDVDR